MLYLFDCDGVLVDSEIIASEVDAEMLTEAGYKITADEVHVRFAGLTMVDIVARVEDEMGAKLPEDFLSRQREELNKRLAEEVDPIEGVHDMLDRINAPFCVCSNSSMARLRITMERTQLHSRFSPNIFSAVEVGNKLPKPNPNVYAHALKTMGGDPAEAVVLEDSAFGVEAARGAGLRVVGFTGGGHTYPGHADVLTDAGAETCVNRMSDYLETAKALVAWRREAV